MDLESSWSLIEQGRLDEALLRATEEYNNDPTSFAPLRHRAISSLLLKEYKGALNDFLTVLNTPDPFYVNNEYYENDRVNDKGDGDYIDVGVAYWLLNEHDAATKMWIDAMTLRFKYTNNIMIPPCVGFFAGVYLNDLKIIREAKKYIKKRYRKTIPLGRFLLDEITEEELLGEIKPASPLKDRTTCKYEFYIASKHLEKGDKSGFIEHLKKCVETKKIIESEYFLAVGELDKIERNPQSS